MFISFEDRLSESPLVERVWRCHSATGGAFHSMAESNLELVVSRLPAMVTVTLRGPVTRASVAECPSRGEWLAIRFRPGVYFPSVPTYHLLDHRNLDLPVVDRRRFWFSGLLWNLPTYENAEELVERLLHEEAQLSFSYKTTGS
ncbi:MAG TPA: hypothetical protein VFY39_12885 [Gammaproteobacteria bacterium]|nr:hypothetical protein [Gammaproteobacteria bacterium]